MRQESLYSSELTDIWKNDLQNVSFPDQINCLEMLSKQLMSVSVKPDRLIVFKTDYQNQASETVSCRSRK